MAKAITQTTIKILETHDRIAVKVRYVNGQELLLSATRNGERVSYKGPSEIKNNSGDLNLVAKFFCAMLVGENHLQRSVRMEAFFAKTVTLADAARQLA